MTDDDRPADDARATYRWTGSAEAAWDYIETHSAARQPGTCDLTTLGDPHA